MNAKNINNTQSNENTYHTQAKFAKVKLSNKINTIGNIITNQANPTSNKQFENQSKRSEKKFPSAEDRDKKEIEVVDFKRRLYLLEILIITFLTILTLSELALGINIYSLYSYITTRNYYENLKFYVRNVDYLFDISQQPSSNCTNGLSAFNMQQVKEIEGICLMKTSTGYNFSYDVDYPTNNNLGVDCTKTRLKLDKTMTVNFWDNLFYCSRSYSMNDVNFYFTTQKNCSQFGGVQCGSYHSLTYCMKAATSNFNETRCPFNNVVLRAYHPQDIPGAQSMKINNIDFQMVREVSEDFYHNCTFFSFRLMYGNLTASTSDAVLDSLYISYYLERYIDFSASATNSIMPMQVDADSTRQFFKEYFSGYVSQTLTPLGKVNVLDTPRSYFSVSYKRNSLPKQACMPFFTYETNGGKDYMSTFNLFIDYIQISAPRYIGYVLMDLLFIGPFHFYLRGVLIYYELKEGKTKKYKSYFDHEEVSAKTKILFSSFILFLKLFSNLVQLVYLAENISFVTNITDANCFSSDPYLAASLKHFLFDLPQLRNFTLSTIWIMTTSYLLMIFFSVLENRYFGKKVEFEEVERLYKEGVEYEKNKKKTKMS